MEKLPVVNPVGLPQYDAKTKSVCGHLKKKGRYTWSMRYIWVSIDIADNQNYKLAYGSSFSRNLKSKRTFQLNGATLTKDKDHMFMIKLADGKCLLFACLNEPEAFRWEVSLQYIIEVAGQRAEYFTQQRQHRLESQQQASHEEYKEEVGINESTEFIDEHAHQHSPPQPALLEQQDEILASITCATNESDASSTLTGQSFDAEAMPSKEGTLLLFSPAARLQQANTVKDYRRFASTIADDEDVAAAGFVQDDEVSPKMMNKLCKLAKKDEVTTRKPLQEMSLLLVTVTLLMLAFVISVVVESIKATTMVCFSPVLIIGEKAVTVVFVLVGNKKCG